MKCPTCGEIMYPTNATRGEWCEQCGTMTNGDEVHVPKLVEAVSAVLEQIDTWDDVGAQEIAALRRAVKTTGGTP
jgi:uncharacterized OB-fold protein